jgi:arginine/ornithine N-succinyltransferase beta subunit
VHAVPRPEYQKNRNGLFLSKARFLFIAAFRELFSPHLFAELRGRSDEQGNSPSGTRWAITFSTFRLPMPTG